MTTGCATTRADLHVHSRYSDHQTIKGIRLLRGRESYTEPLDIYRLARARGMDLVTITDHNSLDGSLAIAHLPGTLTGVEFDTWFPEDGCRIHVVALGLDESTFAAAAEATPSVYDLVACLREADVLHYLAHPLFDMTGHYTTDTIEKLLLLFNVLEGRNGSRVSRCNDLLQSIVATLTPERVMEMAERQRISPHGETPWRKTLVGGSDDHSGLFVAGAHTEAQCDGTVDGFLAAVRDGACAPGGDDGTARQVAHAIYAASFWRIREILRLDEPAPQQRALGLLRKGFGRIGRDVPILEKTMRGVRSVAPGLYRDGDPRGPAWEQLVDERLGSLLAQPGGIATVGSRDLNARIFTVAMQLADDVLELHLETLLDPSCPPSPRQRLRSSFAVGMVNFLALPYFIAWIVQARDRRVRNDLRAWLINGAEADGADGGVLPAKLAIFAADGCGDGAVALGGLDARRIAAAPGAQVEIIATGHAPAGDIVTFRALATGHTHGGDDAFVVPPLIDIIDHLEEHGFTAVHAGGPGPMGLTALVAAKLLRLPTSASWVTAPATEGSAGGDVHRTLDLAAGRRYRAWFYRSVDEVVAPSRSDARDAVAHGVDPHRVRIVSALAPAG